MAFAISAFRLVEGLRAGEMPKVLGLGSTLAFAALVIVSYATNDQFLERWIQPLTGGCLLVIAVVAVLVGRPFARQHAREQVAPEVQRSPALLWTTTVITWVWVGAFAVMMVSSLMAMPRSANWVIPFIALALGVLFTKWYPDEVRRQGRAEAASA